MEPPPRIGNRGVSLGHASRAPATRRLTIALVLLATLDFLCSPVLYLLPGTVWPPLHPALTWVGLLAHLVHRAPSGPGGRPVPQWWISAAWLLRHHPWPGYAALGLRWDDVDLDRRTISIRRNLGQVNHRMVLGKPKTTRSARVFVMLPQAPEDLRRQKAWQETVQIQVGKRWQEMGAVFTDANGGCLLTARVQHTFSRVRDRANARVCEDAHKDPTRNRLIPELPLYSLRHAAGSILLNAGVPPAMAAKIMGHSVDIFMETYAELLVEATREAADAAGAFLEVHTPSKAPPPTAVLPRRTSVHGGRPRSRADTHGMER